MNGRRVREKRCWMWFQGPQSIEKLKLNMLLIVLSLKNYTGKERTETFKRERNCGSSMVIKGNRRRTKY